MLSNKLLVVTHTTLVEYKEWQNEKKLETWALKNGEKSYKRENEFKKVVKGRDLW